MKRSVLTTFFVLGYLPLIGIAPYLVPVDPTLASASSLFGYNTHVAYVLFVAWSITGMVAAAALERIRPRTPFLSAPHEQGSETSAGWRRLEVAAAFLATLVLLWPPFLARSGPYYESVYFLNTLHRLQSGLLPYREFEFSYGPLMLWMLQQWADMFGYSMLSYFWLLALIEAAHAAALVAVLQRIAPDFSARMWILIVLAVQLFNISLGLNTTAVRLLIPLAAVIAVALRPTRLDVIAGGGIVLGLTLAFSHDTGAVALMAALGVLGLLAWKERRISHVARGFLLGALTIATWALCVRLILGDLTPDYVTAALHQMSRRSAGESAFPFHWSIQSISVFSIVGLVCLVVGSGLGRSRHVPLSSGDRVLFAGLVFAFVAMKGGLSRCDMSHLSRAILGLTIALLPQWRLRVFSMEPGLGRALRTAVLIMVVTTAAGWAPATRGYFAIWASGALAPKSQPAAFEGRAPSIEAERASPEPDIMALASFVAQPQRRSRPVFCYGDAWWLYMRIGAFSQVYPSDFTFLSDADAVRDGELLRSRPDTIVIMRRVAYRRLFDDGTAVEVRHTRLSEAERIGRIVLSRISSVHFSYVDAELTAVGERVDRTVGLEIRRSWRPVRTFGEFVVLENIGSVTAALEADMSGLRVDRSRVR